MMRAVATMLLMVAVATPALAEIGCADERGTHLQEIEGSTRAAFVADALPDDEGKSGQPGHCAFNHGHCAAVPIGALRADHPASIPATYSRLKAPPLIDHGLVVLERPPAA